jgi:lysozyme
MTYPKICDISEYQPVIDWPRLAELGVGIIVRCGQSNFEDGRFQEHYANALAAGVPVGIYFFFQPNLGPEVQITEFLRIYNGLAVKPKVISLDVENIAYTDANGTKINILPPSPEIHSVWLMQWLSAVEKATGITPGIYTRQNYWDEWVRRSGAKVNYKGIDYTLPNWSHYWLWVASWTNYSSDIRMPKDWTTWKVWQYEGGTGRQDGIAGPVDLDSYNGTQDQMIEFFGKKVTTPMATLLYKTTVKQADRATLFTWRSDQALKVAPTELGANAVILRMGGYDEWDAGHKHMPVYSDPTFKGRFKQLATAGIPVIGRFNIHGGRWGIEQFGKEPIEFQSCPGNFDEAQKQDSVRQNLALPGLLSSWCDGNFSMDGLFAKTLKWLDVKAIEIGSTKTIGFKDQPVNDFWQTLSFNHTANPLRWLMLRGYIPNVPIILYTGPWWLWLYQNDFTMMLNNAKEWLWLHLGEWTQTNTREFPTLSELWEFRPADSFKFTSYPDLYFERILAHEYSDQSLKVKGQLTDANGGSVTVSLNLWNDTQAAMGNFLGATITPPIEPPIEPPVTDPDLAAVIARLAALESQVAKLIAGLKAAV